MKFNHSILKAFKNTIIKWDNIILNGELDKGSDNCSLCKWNNKYYKENDFSNTIKRLCICPVAYFTKKERCEGIGYMDWLDHHRKLHNKKSSLNIDESFAFHRIECDECKEIAIKIHMNLIEIFQKTLIFINFKK